MVQSWDEKQCHQGENWEVCKSPTKCNSKAMCSSYIASREGKYAQLPFERGRLLHILNSVASLMPFSCWESWEKFVVDFWIHARAWKHRNHNADLEQYHTEHGQYMWFIVKVILTRQEYLAALFWKMVEMSITLWNTLQFSMHSPFVLSLSWQLGDKQQNFPGGCGAQIGVKAIEHNSWGGTTTTPASVC